MNQHRVAHQPPGETGDDLDRVVIGADLDVPGVRSAGTRQLGHRSGEAKHEDLGLNRPFGVEASCAFGIAQSERAMARTCSRVTVML